MEGADGGNVVCPLLRDNTRKRGCTNPLRFTRPRNRSRAYCFYMNPLSYDNIPQICSEVGLSCESCTAENARHLAAVCKGLPGKMVAQLFVQIYPSSACAPMH